MLAAETPNSKTALIHFLNSALYFTGEHSIIDLEVINPAIPVDNKKKKKSVFDIRVRFKNGQQAIVEMEFHKKDDFKRRSQFLVSRAYSSQDISGNTYADLKKCYLICIMNYPLFDDDRYYRDIMFRDEHGTPLTDDEVIIFLELSKIKKLLNKPVDELSDIEMWMLFFRYVTDKSKRELLNKILEKKEGIGMAAQILKEMSMSEQERMIYEAELIYELDQRSAKRAVAIGIARKFKERNVPFDVIAESTGLRLAEVEAL